MSVKLKQWMRKIKGFTLLEMVIVIVVLGIVASIAAPMIYTAAQASQAQSRLSDILGQARSAMIRMSRDLRNIRSTDASDLVMGASSLSLIDVNTDAIAYTLSSGNLLRNGQILAQGVSNLSFTYYDANAAVTAVNANVRYIKFSFTVTRNTISETFYNLIYVRNA
jgi:prepilin-type N-terminal cleavage/methylation domain-containing protein